MRLHSLARPFTAAATVLALLGGVLVQSPAAHAEDWCWGDPVFSVHGLQTQVIAGVQGPGAAATGVVANIVVYIPRGVDTAVIVPPVVTPFPETLTFVQQGIYSGTGKIPVTVKVTFTSPTKMPTAMQVTFPTGKTSLFSGVTNATLSTTFME